MQNKSKYYLLLAAAAVCILAASAAFYMIWEDDIEAKDSVKAMPISADRPGRKKIDEITPLAQTAGRKDGVCTILFVGNDQGNGNTDTMILARLDTKEHSFNAVSIPRDTLINRAWKVRKLNAVYWGSEKGGGEGISELLRSIRQLTGFTPDCYAVVDLSLLSEAVDTIGGIDFDVPMPMDYDDESQNLHIHFDAGYQHLSGAQVTELCRYRSGFADGDIGRIKLQQDFLKSAAGQMISIGSIPSAPKLVKLLSEKLTTDLSASNIAWLLRQFMLCKDENINFYTAPNDAAVINSYSYAVLRTDEWVTMINDYLNPFTEPITAADLDIVYRNGDEFCATRTLIDRAYYTRENEAPFVAEEAAPDEKTVFYSPEE